MPVRMAAEMGAGGSALGTIFFGLPLPCVFGGPPTAAVKGVGGGWGGCGAGSDLPPAAFEGSSWALV